MGYYEDKILPHVVQFTCGMPAMRKVRRKATAGLHGDVVEIGFGSGSNVGCYPDEVESVTAMRERVQDFLRSLEPGRHVVVTQVTRDDLPDGGAAHMAATVRSIHSLCPGTTVEVHLPLAGA